MGWFRRHHPLVLGLEDVSQTLPRLAVQLEQMRRDVHRLHAEILALDIAVGRTLAVVAETQTHVPPPPVRPPMEFTYEVRARDEEAGRVRASEGPWFRPGDC